MCFEFLYGLLPRFIQAIIKSFSRLFISILEGVLFLQGFLLGLPGLLSYQDFRAVLLEGISGLEPNAHFMSRFW